jgi:hypothetical protein
MKLTGITGTDIQVRQVKDDTTLRELQGATKHNGLDEIVVQNDKGKFIIFADSLDVKGKFGLPAVGTQVNFGDVQGKVILSDREILAPKSTGSEDKIKSFCIKTPGDIAQEAKATAEKAKAELGKKISEAEKTSEANTNTASIYGPQVTLEDAQGWLKNNPDLAQSPKLVKLADFKTINGKVDADELAKIASGGAVVLNGPNSFYLPGEKKPESGNATGTTKQPMSAQEEYYRRKNAQENAEAAADLAVGVGGALLNGLNSILR